MKYYVNRINNLIYWMDKGRVYMSNGEMIRVSMATTDTLREMIVAGEVVEADKSKPEVFAKLVSIEKIINPQYNERFIAFLVANGKGVMELNVARRNAMFMRWISDRRGDYVRLNGHKVKRDYCTGDAIILDHADFTDFIAGGKWL